jgi:deoxyribodipyrimidine photo-lyase
MNITNLVWFKSTDLRLRDHQALKCAFSKKKSNVLLVFCIDPFFFSKTKYAHVKFEKYKEKFLYESVINLYENIKKYNGHLNIYFDSPENVIPTLVDTYNIKTIYHTCDTTSEELTLLENIKKKTTINIKGYWSNTIYHVEDIEFPIPIVFSHFKNKVSKLPIREECNLNLKKLSRTIKDIDNIDILVNKMNNIPVQLVFKGGEDTAWKRLQYYFFESKLLSSYKSTRNNLLGEDFSSKFSPYLAFGNISAKSIHHQIKIYEDTIVKNESTYWLYFELVWRDFFRFSSKQYGNKLFHQSGIADKSIVWKSICEPKIKNLFEHWKNGTTGYPYIDAIMIELKETGYTSNRGRQMVASFLTKDLKIDWRAGADYFESILIDHDVASNYGNWNYSAGVGSDPRENRYFNIFKQCSTYDSNCEFILFWIPELKKYSKSNIINASNLKNYHCPIVSLKTYKNYNK